MKVWMKNYKVPDDDVEKLFGIETTADWIIYQKDKAKENRRRATIENTSSAAAAGSTQSNTDILLDEATPGCSYYCLSSSNMAGKICAKCQTNSNTKSYVFLKEGCDEHFILHQIKPMKKSDSSICSGILYFGRSRVKEEFGEGRTKDFGFSSF